MKEHIMVLKNGEDIKKEIVDYSNRIKMSAGIIVCCVGSINKVNIKVLDPKTIFNMKKSYKIIGANGTISLDGININMLLADEKGNVVGGKLLEGCIVDKTAEIVMLELDEYRFARKYNHETKCKELDYHLRFF
jgi:hypothetical protein